MYITKWSKYAALILLGIVFLCLSTGKTGAQADTDECRVSLGDSPGIALLYWVQVWNAEAKHDYDRAINAYTQFMEYGLAIDISYVLRGNAYANAGDFERAEADLNCAIELNPNFADAYYVRGELYHNTQRYDLARDDFTRAIELEPDEARGYFGRAQAYLFGSANMDDALPDLTRTLELDPTHADAYFFRGLIYTQKGQFEQAIADYSQAIDLSEGTDTAAFLWRARAYNSIGDYERAVADLQQGVRLAPDDAEYRIDLGMNLSLSGNPQAALFHLNRGLELDSRNARGYRARATAHILQGDLEGALEDLGSAITFEPDNAEYYWARAVLYKLQDDYELALDDLTISLELLEDARTYRERADTYYHLKDYTHAVEDYTEALALDPDNYRTYLSRSVNYMRLNEAEAAVADLDTAITLMPETIESYAYRAAIYVARRDYEQALESYDQVILLDPEYEEAYYSRASIHAKLGDLDLADADMSRAMEIDGMSATDYAMRAVVIDVAREQYAQALADVNTAIRMEPENAAYYGNRGAVYLKQGNQERARADFERALELDEDNLNAKRALADLAFEAGDYETALSYYIQFLDYFYFDFELYQKIGRTYEALDRNAEALDAYRIYLAFTGEFADPEIVERAAALEASASE